MTPSARRKIKEAPTPLFPTGKSLLNTCSLEQRIFFTELAASYSIFPEEGIGCFPPEMTSLF